MSESLPSIDKGVVLETLAAQQPLTGMAPPGIQQLVIVRAGDSMTIGIGPLVLDQPGVVSGEELFWGQAEQRRCIIAATSPGTLVRAVRPSAAAAEPTDAADRNRIVKASTKLRSGRNGQPVVTIPERVRPGYIPIPDGAVDVDLSQLDTRDSGIADPEPGMLYLVVAEHYERKQQYETALLFLPIHRVASDLTVLNLSGQDGTYEQPLLTPLNRQGRILTSLPTHRHLSPYIEQLDGTEAITRECRTNVAHGANLTVESLLSAIDRLVEFGGLAIAARQ